jgi:serine protease Do
VAEVTKDSPADAAGLERGDVITVFNGTTVTDAHELPVLVAQTPVGETVSVTVLRSAEEKTVTVKLGELTDQQATAQGSEESEEGWGLTVANLAVEVRRRFQLAPDQKGVAVIEVAPGSPAALAGIQRGDVIEEVNRQPIESVADFTKVMADAKDNDALVLLLPAQSPAIVPAAYSL